VRALAFSAIIATVLVAVYLALGGASYAPAKVADPCAARDWTEPDSLQEVGNQIVLSALDGVACEIGATREEVVLAFESEDTLEDFAGEHGVDKDDLERLARVALERAITDAEEAEALSPQIADLIRGVVERIPPGVLLDLLERAPELLFPTD
jgi:hypothetical protein